MIKEPLFDITEAGDTVTLTCIVIGFGLQSVVWSKQSDGTLEMGDYNTQGVYVEYYLYIVQYFVNYYFFTQRLSTMVIPVQLSM